MSTSPAVAPLEVKKPLTSSILLWVRTDQPRQTGMDHWKGPHSGIISATPGLEEYRQIHLAEHNPGRWPATDGVQTAIPAERKIDGVAGVTFRSALAPLTGACRRSWPTPTRSTCSAGPCSTPARRTPLGGTTSKAPDRRSAPAR
ncbi:hypothetical protein JHN52_09200 [Streptomyces sp. MBT97]|uniref:hypothetical protein n=1 Tax=Streptomyces sp. MBT97 TaxID=2800411 RepID=UPI00190CE756|nr:hypothetical protein [Streptomyces sp. MBT97]MBK3633123.1 hypothetical protein [Streptomyces sp. MBT97]